MKRFVEEYPEFQKLSSNVAKHVTLVSELSSKVSKGSLLEISEVEQSMASSDNHAAHSKSVQRLVNDPNIAKECKLNLVLLYALRYEKVPNNLVAEFATTLTTAGMDISIVNMSKIRSRLCSNTQDLQPGWKIWNPTTCFQKPRTFSKDCRSDLIIQGVENVYAQHTPRLVTVLQDLIKGKLKDQNFPFIEGSTRDKFISLM